MIITFLYRIQGVTERSYGKYIGKAPIYEEGLDRGLVELLFPLFQHVYPSFATDTSDVSIGVLFVDREAKDYYSEEEKNVFDLLYCQWPAMPVEVFVKGQPVRL
jgi:hypothetical protein